MRIQFDGSGYLLFYVSKRSLNAPLVMELPKFKYHPNPLETGSIEVSSNKCLACGEARGFIYKGQPYAEKVLIDALCPWCIADGKAHEIFDAEFVDAAAVGGYGVWEPVSDEIVAEVA